MDLNPSQPPFTKGGENMFQHLKNKIPYLILAALLLVAIFVWLAVWELTPDDKVRIDFFDVGQGSAIFIAAPNNNQVLIDGGPSDAVLGKLGQAMPMFDRRIELIVLTHPDADHLNGLVEVLKRYQVEKILETGISDSSAEYQIWHKLIKEKNVPMVFAQAGQKIAIADNLTLKIIYPLGKIVNEDFANRTNSASIVSKLVYGRNSFLFTGDTEESTESILEWDNADLRADILQVGHHGSKSSTSEKFLELVAPKLAVIQAGLKNKYGHPSQEVLSRLKNIKIFRTDLDGDIVFYCDLAKCENR